MPKLLRSRIFWLLVVVFSILVSSESFAQGCRGANGSGIFTGSIANRDNGSICANNAVAPGLMEIDINNIDPSGTVAFDIDWDDGSAIQRVTATRPSPGTQPTRFFASATHNFPPTGGQVQCAYFPRVTLVWNNAQCTGANLGTPPRFVRWNRDNENTGRLDIVETVTGVPVYEVCAGVETNVTFTDRSTLNCVPPDEVLSPNDARRWRQFTYGTVNTITGTVRVGGVNVPAGGLAGPVDQSTPPTVNSGFPTATTRVITVPATAQVGEEFHIRMDYWNFCNPFGQAPVFDEGIIRIVAQPPAPTGGDAQFCHGTTPAPFEIFGVPGGNVVTWYRNVTGPDRPGTMITSGTGTTLNINMVPGYTNNTVPGNYTVWATYRPNVANALNCESPPVKVVRTIREDLTMPTPTTAPPAQICNNNSFNLVMPAPPTTTYGGATEYQFQGSTGITIGSSTATSATFNVNYTFAPGQLYQDQTVRVTRRYTTTPRCSENQTFTVRIYNETVGGTPTNFPDVCEGTSVGPITLNGFTGTIVRWMVSKDGAPFATYTGPASGNSITPGLLSDGTYQFYAMVDNGPCNTVNSATETVVVTDNPTPPTAGPDQSFCSPIAAGPVSAPAPMSATLPAGTGTWTYVGSVPAGRPSPTFTANNPNTTVTISDPSFSGKYTMRWTVVSGSCTFTDEVELDFGAEPDQETDNTVAACGETATLPRTSPRIGEGVWSVVSGPGGCVGAGCPIAVTDVLQPNSDVSLNGPAFVYGTYRLRWTVTSGTCPSKSMLTDVTFSEPLTVTATDINGICLAATGTTAINLSGTFTPTTASGAWQVVTGNGTTTGTASTGGTSADVYTAVNADYVAGTPLKVKLVVTAPAGSSCPVVEQEIDINVDRTPVADAGAASIDVCENFLQLNAQNPPPYSATGRWTLVSGSATFDNVNDPQTTIRNLPAPGNSVVARWTLTSAGGNNCTHYDDITINRITAPNATNINPVLCEDLPAGGTLTTTLRLIDFESSVTSIPVADRTIQWYVDAPPPVGTPVADPTLTFTNVPNSKVYVARIRETATGCTSDAFVTINIRPLPTAADGVVALCEDVAGSNTTTNVDLIGDGRYKSAITTPGNVVTWYNTFADAQTNTSPITAPIPSVVGTADVYGKVEYASGTPNCAIIVKLTLNVTPLPPATPINGDATVCMGAPGDPIANLPVQTYQVQSIPGAKYHWTIPTGAGEFVRFAGGGINDFYVLLKFPYASPAPNLDIGVTIELNGCSTVIPDLTIIRSQQPVAPAITGFSGYCENENGVPFSIVGPNPASDYVWEITRQSDGSLGGAFITSGQTTPNVTIEFQTENVFLAVKEINNVCVSPDRKIPIQLMKRPIMADADKEICSDDLTAIVFEKTVAPSPTPSPVDIDWFNITSALYDTDLTFVTPNSQETFPQTHLPANFLANHVFRDMTAVPLDLSYTVVPVTQYTMADPLVPAGTRTFECSGTAQTITITVKPMPQLSLGLDKTVCSDTETGIRMLSKANTFPADKFIVNSITVPAGVTPVSTIVTPDPVTLHDDDVIMHDIWRNTSGVTKDVLYEMIPYSSILGCTGNPPIVVKATIYPRSDIDDPGNPEICNGDLLNVTLTVANNPDAETLWRVKSYDPEIVIGSVAAGIGNITNMILTNNDVVDHYLVIELVARNTEAGATSCTNQPRDITVTVKPSPLANSLTLTPCSDAVGVPTYTANLNTVATSVNPSVGTDPNIELLWYTVDPIANPLATPIPAASLNAYVVTAGTIVYAKVRNIATGCPKVATVTFMVKPNLDVNITPTDLTCNGDNSGKILVSVTGGTADFLYTLNGATIKMAAASNEFKFLSQGTYTIRVEDANGCFFEDNTVQVDQPTPLQFDSNTPTDATCFLYRDGQIASVVSGGTAPYGFTLLQTGSPGPGGVFTGLGEGVYNVKVTDDNGCTLTSPDVPIADPDQVVISSFVVAEELNCENATNGKINIGFTGGNVPPSYFITLRKNGTDLLVDVPSAGPLHQFGNLGSGNYSALVEDARGCPSQLASTIIFNPTAIVAGVIGDNQALCDGADAMALTEIIPATGGVGNYTYQWELSTDNVNFTPIGAATQPTYDPGILPVGSAYYRRVVYSGAPANNCSRITTPVEVKVNPNPIVTFGPSASVLCQGGNMSLRVELLQGMAPFQYDYTMQNAAISYSGYGSTFAQIDITNFQQSEVYTLTRIKDANGCVANPLPGPATVNLVRVNSDFDVLAPAAQCSGGEFSFQFVPEADIQYTWTWSDGTQTSVASADLNVGVANVIKHVYNVNDTDNSTQFLVKLDAFATTGPGCQAPTTLKNVTVFPTIKLAISPGDTILCSGEQIRFADQSKGVDVGKWYYRPVGSNDQLDQINGPVPAAIYTLYNNTTTNDIFYEVVYEASNHEGCTGRFTQEVKVWRGIDAHFSYAPPNPELVGGVATVQFTNDSNPVEPTQFSYDWDFGDVRASQPTASGVGPFAVDYYSTGYRDVRLQAQNIDAKAVDNKECRSVFVQKIDITTPGIFAMFKATPLAACYPMEIVTENLSGAFDTFYWEIYDQAGLVTTSNLKEPVFKIQAPGKYEIILHASVAGGSQTDIYPDQAAGEKAIIVEVFDVPSALFELRPNPIYVPDTEMQTFNKSERSDSWFWDFGDGGTSNEFEPRYTYKVEGTYFVTLVSGKNNGNKDINGDGVLDGDVVCYDTARQELVARDGGFIKLPNAFTPSPTGATGGTPGYGTFNDVFLPITRGVEEFQMQIFDRWGNLLFESKDKNVGWDGYDRNGRLMPAGVYVFKLTLRLSDGQRTTKVGDVTLIR